EPCQNERASAPDRISGVGPISKMHRAARLSASGPEIAGLRGRSALRRRSLRRLAVATLGHELIELLLVLREAQPLEEVTEFALLLFEPAQRLAAIRVEGVIAARTGRAPGAEAVRAEALHLLAHAAHLVLHALHLPLPAVAAIATHVSAPEC